MYASALSYLYALLSISLIAFLYSVMLHLYNIFSAY
jgi:hypothetical protein